MLILSRKIGERLMIGEGVAVTILGVSGRNVRIGIDAAHRIPIYREEARRKVPADRGEGAPK